MKKTTALLLVAVTIVSLIIMGRLYISEADFSLENPAWNGISAISSVADVRPLDSLSGLSDVNASDTLLIVSPQSNYTFNESACVAAFIQRGGRVVVMDDFGMANSLLSGINSSVTLYQVPLCQGDSFYKKPSLPVITNITASAETSNVSALTLNHPVPLNVSGNARVLATTSILGWLDFNDSAVHDMGEPYGVYPVIASWSPGGTGELLVIGDADLFANSVLDQTDNRAFMRNVLSGVVWLDVSHSNNVTPLGALYYDIMGSPAIQIIIVILIFACGYLFIKRDRLKEILHDLAANGKKRNGGS